MAVTVEFFNKFVENMGGGNIDMKSDTFKIMLVTSSYTFDPTDETKADLGAVELANGNGYTTGGATIGSTTFSYAAGKTTFDGGDVTWTASGGDIGPVTGAVIYSDTSSGDLLVCYIDFDGAQTAGDTTDFKIVFHADGILAFQAAA